MPFFAPAQFTVDRDDARCIRCKVCVNQCSFEVHAYEAETDEVRSRDERCVGCHRCEALCPTRALAVRFNPMEIRPNANWRPDHVRDLQRQADTGGVLLTGAGNDKPFRVYWDHLLLNASQVTNPSIDPLREPMELRTILGRKPDRLDFDDLEGELTTELGPQLVVETPIVFSGMSYGAISYNAHLALNQAAQEFGTLYNTGEGGWPTEFRRFGNRTIVQCASGRFGIDLDYLESAAAVEIKIGQGAKPGIGGHLPAEKVTAPVARTRMIPAGTDALSPAPQHDIYSIEDLAMLIGALKEATGYAKPVCVKISAVHNAAAIASGAVRAGADIIAIDGLRGGTGAAPKVIRDNVGIPIELALAAVHDRLVKEGIRNHASILAAGGIRSSADVVKAIALGADAVYIGTAALVAMGCTLCQMCYTGKCNWGIAVTDPWLTKRLNPDLATRHLVNLLRAWSLEIKEMLGGMGINAIESLRGNRLQLRGVGLEEWELEVLGVRGAGA
ncbi:MAG: glutamate synthase-related protein [Bacillota bacterium]